MKRQIQSILVLTFCAGIFFSCSSLNLFQDDPAINDNTGQEHMAYIETHIAEMKSDQDNLEQQIQNKQEIISNLENKVTALEHKLKTLENQKTKSKTSPLKSDENEPSQLYKKARGPFLEQNAIKASELFMVFVKKIPGNSLSDNAMYWIRECYYTLGQYKKAIL
jgi:TolA-binding protein